MSVAKKTEMCVCVYVCVHEAPLERRLCEASMGFVHIHSHICIFWYFSLQIWGGVSLEELHKAPLQKRLCEAPLEDLYRGFAKPL